MFNFVHMPRLVSVGRDLSLKLKESRTTCVKLIVLGYELLLRSNALSTFLSHFSGFLETLLWCKFLF